MNYWHFHGPVTRADAESCRTILTTPTHPDRPMTLTPPTGHLGV